MQEKGFNKLRQFIFNQDFELWTASDEEATIIWLQGALQPCDAQQMPSPYLQFPTNHWGWPSFTSRTDPNQEAADKTQ